MSTKVPLINALMLTMQKHDPHLKEGCPILRHNEIYGSL